MLTLCQWCKPATWPEAILGRDCPCLTMENVTFITLSPHMHPDLFANYIISSELFASFFNKTAFFSLLVAFACSRENSVSCPLSHSSFTRIFTNGFNFFWQKTLTVAQYNWYDFCLVFLTYEDLVLGLLKGGTSQFSNWVCATVFPYWRVLQQTWYVVLISSREAFHLLVIATSQNLENIYLRR